MYIIKSESALIVQSCKQFVKQKQCNVFVSENIITIQSFVVVRLKNHFLFS